MNKYTEHQIEAKEIIKEAREFAKLGKVVEEEKVLLDGLEKYPDNVCIKNKLLDVCFSQHMQGENSEYYVEQIEKLALELKEIECYKYNAIRVLAYLYRRLGRQDEIFDDVKQLPSVWQCKTFLMPEVLKNEERIKGVQQNFEVLINLFDFLLLSTCGREEVGKRDKILLKEKVVIDAIFEDGDYGMFSHHLQNIYYRCARDQAYVKNKEKVIKYLKEAIKYTKEYDDLRFNKKELKHTSFLVDRLYYKVEDYTFTKEETLTHFMIESLKDELFDFIREDDVFKELLEQLNNA